MVLRLVLLRLCFIRGPSHGRHRNTQNPHDSAESQTRIDLAACYRLVDLFGWSDLINTRITAPVPGPQNHFLINRFGMLYDEITASQGRAVG
jgi:hypothetical protein